MPSRKALVLGCNGRFGQRIGRRLKQLGVEACGVDLQAVPSTPDVWDRYHQDSITSPSRALLAQVRSADWVVFCTPEADVLSSLPVTLPLLKPSACAIDIAAVKSRIASVVRRIGARAGYVSLHPLYAPSEHVEAGNIAFVPIVENAATRRVWRYLVERHANVVRLSAQEHDEAASLVQTAAHAALLAYGLILARSDVDRATLERLETPLQRSLLALLSRIVTNGLETYRSIQFDNPWAASARMRLVDALESLEKCTGRRDEGWFADLFADIGAFLGKDLAPLLEESRAIARTSAKGIRQTSVGDASTDDIAEPAAALTDAAA